MYVSNTTVPNATCFGPNDCTGGAETEASLDIQYLMALTPGYTTEYWLFSGDTLDFCGTVMQWTQLLLATPNPPIVQSVSYGFQGDLGEAGCTQAHINGVENDLAKAAALGISIIFASGDQGNGQDEGNNKLYSSWPGSSPYVTSVGATQFQNFTIGHPQEAAAYTFTSGGGFAWSTPRAPAASWQDTAVNAYLQSGIQLPPTASWNASGRASPDVSALGEGFMIVTHGVTSPRGSGTSAATPLFASMVTLLNEARLNSNKTALGLLNPWLYQNAAMFTDITAGSDSKNTRDENAFLCSKGWDPVSGLGTPVFKRMLKAVAELP